MERTLSYCLDCLDHKIHEIFIGFTKNKHIPVKKKICLSCGKSSYISW